jgi:site-specific recombinase XerD
LRISELVNILIENIDFNLGSIRVLGKGNKERDVPISRLTVREIRHYMHMFRSKICKVESPSLFPRPDGTPISINCIQQFMRRLAKKAGLEGIKLHPHLLRHSFGTQFITNGGNIVHLQAIMGHSSLNTTLKYTHLQSEDLRREHAKFSPVGNLTINKNRYEKNELKEI